MGLTFFFPRGAWRRRVVCSDGAVRRELLLQGHRVMAQAATQHEHGASRKHGLSKAKCAMLGSRAKSSCLSGLRMEGCIEKRDKSILKAAS